MKHKCKRCGHEWLARTEKKPASCPACKNYAWDREKGESRKLKAGDYLSV